VRNKDHLAYFGIFGAKFVPRVLAEHGYVDDALELFLQPNYPSWGYMRQCHAVSLWENWKGTSSQNHIIFGDCSAWMYEYLAGFKPGLSEITPKFPKKLNHVRASYCGVTLEWIRQPNAIKLSIAIPDGMKILLHLPNGEHHELEKCKFGKESSKIFYLKD